MRKTKPQTFSLIALLLIAGLLGLYVGSKIYLYPLNQTVSIRENSLFFPKDLDTPSSSWQTLAWGYTLGPWPNEFKGNPPVTRLTYKPGPPKNFIHRMTYILDPILDEIWIDGPRTIKPSFNAAQWKTCFQSQLQCVSEKRLFSELALSDLIALARESSKPQWSFEWIENSEPFSARGLVTKLKISEWLYIRATLFTPKGVSQSFTLKTSAKAGGESENPTIELFNKILGGLKVNDDLTSGRQWAQAQIRAIRLDKIKHTQELKFRLREWAHVQVLLSSLLSISPTEIDPFFHFAGVSHEFAVDLMKSKDKVFESQESWINIQKPNLEAIVKYSKDFASENLNRKSDPRLLTMLKNIESLLQDLYLLEQKLSR